MKSTQTHRQAHTYTHNHTHTGTRTNTHTQTPTRSRENKLGLTGWGDKMVRGVKLEYWSYWTDKLFPLPYKVICNKVSSTPQKNYLTFRFQVELVLLKIQLGKEENMILKLFMNKQVLLRAIGAR